MLSNNDNLFIHYGNELIYFKTFEHQVDKVVIKVYPNGKVKVFSPQTITTEELTTHVAKKSRWIYK